MGDPALLFETIVRSVNTIDRHQFDGVLHHLPNNLLIIDDSGVIIYANNQLEKTFGYTKEEVLGQKAQILIPDYQRKLNAKKRSEFYTRPHALPIGSGVEVTGVKKNGEEFPMEVGLTPFNRNGANLLAVTIIDNTKRKKVEEDLIKKNELLNLGEQINQIGHWQWNVIDDKITWSDNLYAMFQREKGGELCYETYFSYVYEEDSQFVLGRTQKILEDKQFYDFFHRIKTGTGQIKTVHLMGKVFLNERGEVAEMVGTCQDVTKQKADEKRVELFTQQLQAKNKELEMFAYVAGHDLKEPVRTIGAMTQLFMQSNGASLNEEGRELMEIISNAAGRMKQLINDLSDYSKLGTDRTQSTHNCTVIMEEVCKDLAVAIDEANAEIVFNKLPVVQCYRTELRLLFQNLISNAIKFRKPNEKPVIHVSAELNEDSWTFAVKDNGIGMAKDCLPDIFQIFRRLHSREEYPGTGIGLAHCKKIVELHEGEIWVESEQGKGSTFYFTIPLS